jgi:small-conductance mechanosensitive channel
MKATEFEYRHQTLIHQLIVGAAFLTYLLDRNDVVWRFVKDTAVPHQLERLAFIIATLLIAVGAAICTWAGVYRRSQQRYLGDVFYSIGLASLMPLAGFVILVAGDVLRVLRLSLRAGDHTEEIHRAWRRAFRQEAVKWGMLLTMIVFVITLVDRHAEILAAASFLVGTLLNPPFRVRGKTEVS